LEELNLEYDLRPTPPENKPQWLLDQYDGKLPALRHDKECYVESEVILSYLLFFFGKDKLESKDNGEAQANALFPALAQYLKHTPDGDDQDQEKLSNLRTALSSMQDHLGDQEYWCGSEMTLADCRLAPRLYHLTTGCQAFKADYFDFAKEFPALHAYSQRLFARDSFQATQYPASVVEWGWGNARS